MSLPPHISRRPQVQCRNIILAGFMGSGKTTVARILAQRLRWRFMDTDKVIERESGKSIPEIFETEGEARFRDIETELALDLKDCRGCVIATGGGFVLRPKNREAAEKAGRLIFLMASADAIWHRVKQSRGRPLLRTADPKAKIVELLAERAEAYGAIPTRVDTDGLTADQVADAVIELLENA